MKIYRIVQNAQGEYAVNFVVRELTVSLACVTEESAKLMAAHLDAMVRETTVSSTIHNLLTQEIVMTKMVEVTQEGANNYSRMLTVLGMEEEGDPVAEVERLLDRVRVLDQNRTIYDSRIKMADELRRVAPLLYSALKNLLEAVEERHALAESIESVTIADARALIERLQP